MTEYDDECLAGGKSLNTRSLLEEFRSSLDTTGDVVQKRRAFLASLLGAASLAVTEGIASAASAEASAIETNANSGGAVMALQEKIHGVGRLHMQPNQNPNELMADALSAWRDACTLRHARLATEELDHQAQAAEAQAAGLVAQFLGDRGEIKDAEQWYRAALKIAPDDNTRSWLYGCRTWLYLYSGDGGQAKKSAARAAGLATFFNRDRAAFGYHQLARAYALMGDWGNAREHLSNATTNFLFSSGTGNPNTPPNLLTWSLLQNAQYSMDTVAILAYGDGKKSDISRFYTNADLAFDKVDELNGMNGFLVRMSHAKVQASGTQADPDAAVETTMNAVSNLRRVDRETAVVKGRTRLFADELEVRFGDTASVRGLHGFATELAQVA